MDNLFIILAFIIGYYLGNGSQRREDITKIKELPEYFKSHKIKALEKKEIKQTDDQRYEDSLRA